MMNFKPLLRMTGFAVCAGLFFSGPLAAESLRDAVRSAVTENPRARVHDADVKASALELMSLERDYLPTLTATASAGGYYYNDPARLTPANNNRVSAGLEAGLVAEYTIFDGYRRANAVYRDAARVDGTIFGLLDASETLALNAVEAYIDVLRHRQLVAISNVNVSRHQDIQRQVRDLVDGGRLPASERFEVDQRVMAAKLTLVQVREALGQATARYEAVVGHAPGKHMAMPGVSNLPMTRDAFLARATQASYRVKAAETAIRSAEYEQDIGKARDLPQVVLRGGADVGQNLQGVPGRQYDAYVSLGLEWEIFSAGRRARDGALTMRTVQAMAERDKIVREVRELALSTWASYHANIERTVLLDRQLSAARQASNQYQTQFEAGTRTLLDLLDAERAWFNTRFEDVSAEASYAFNQYQLLAIESRLAKHFGIKPAEVALLPDFEARAKSEGAYQIFNTDIPTLE